MDLLKICFLVPPMVKKIYINLNGMSEENVRGRIEKSMEEIFEMHLHSRLGFPERQSKSANFQILAVKSTSNNWKKRFLNSF